MPHIPRSVRRPVPGNKPASRAPLANLPPTITISDDLPLGGDKKADKPDIGRKPVYRSNKKSTGRLGIEKISIANWDVLPADISEAMGIN